MADEDDMHSPVHGHVNLGMDSSLEIVDDVGGNENVDNSDDVSAQQVNKPQPEMAVDRDEIRLRVDKLTSSAVGGGDGATVNGDTDKAVLEPMSEMDQDLKVTFSRDRPFSASVRSRATVASSRSRVSLSPTIATSDFASKSLFSYQTDNFNKAVAKCTESMIQADPDGAVQGAWLLTEIDHWNNDKERIVILTENSLLIIKYDFIRGQPFEGKRIPLISISKLQIGDLVYPPRSLMQNRDYGGVRIYYGNPDSASFSQRWNPWSRAIPFVTITHHMLAYNRHENETVTYNADDMAESLTAAIDSARRRYVGGGDDDQRQFDRVEVDDTPIMIDSYISLLSIIHNQSKLGFYLERGGVSF